MQYQVKSDIYHGPLPLLVDLAKLGLIDIFLVQLIALTQQYLDTVDVSESDLNSLSEPLPLLGTLLALKARGLLPKPARPDDEDDETPVSLEELQRRLKEYEEFKSVADLLSELQVFRQRHFSREAPSQSVDLKKVREPSQPYNVSVDQLVDAFATVLERTKISVYEVREEPWTVESKVIELTEELKQKRSINFFAIFQPARSRMELVVSFLAILELIRQRVVRATQGDSFGDFNIEYCEETGISDD